MPDLVLYTLGPCGVLLPAIPLVCPSSGHCQKTQTFLLCLEQAYPHKFEGFKFFFFHSTQIGHMDSIQRKHSFPKRNTFIFAKAWVIVHSALC